MIRVFIKKYFWTEYSSEADLGLVKLVVMTNVFFIYHQHEIEIKRLICFKQIKYGFFDNSWNQRFYSWYMQNVTEN